VDSGDQFRVIAIPVRIVTQRSDALQCSMALFVANV